MLVQTQVLMSNIPKLFFVQKRVMGPVKNWKTGTRKIHAVIGSLCKLGETCDETYDDK